MNKKTFFIFLTGMALLPAVVLAIDFAAGNAPFAPQGNAFVVTTIVNNILNNILSFIWVIFIGFAVIMFIWAGFLFLTAQGEPEGLKQAQKALLWGIIGVAVGILAFSLPWIIYGGLFGSQNNGGGGGGGGGGGDNIVLGACTFGGTSCSQTIEENCEGGNWVAGGACPARCTIQPGQRCTPGRQPTGCCDIRGGNNGACIANQGESYRCAGAGL